MKNHINISLNDEFDSHITMTQQKNNKILVREQMVKKGTYDKVDGTTVKKRTVANIAQAELAAQELFAERARSLQKHNYAKKSAEATEITPIRNICDEIKAALDSGEYIAFKASWRAESTNRASFTYFCNNILPLVEEHYDAHIGFTPIYSLEIKALYEKKFAEFSKKNNNSGEFEKQQISLSKQFYSANVVYQFLRTNYPDLTLPEADFDIGAGKGFMQEQQKDIPLSVIRVYAHNLYNRLADEPLFVMGAVLMLDAMLRTAEACAVGSDCLFDIDDNNCYVHVKFQLDGAGVRTVILKTENAYRVVVLSYWGTKMIKKCLVAAEKKNLTPGAGIAPNELSRWVLERLNESGLSSECLSAIESDYCKFINTTRDSVVCDTLSAYICRRYRSGILRTVCGISEPELDYAMGHRSDVPHINYVSRQWMVEYARKLEAYVIDAKFSRNPSIVPIDLGKDTFIDNFEKIVLINRSDKPQRFNCAIECHENGTPCLFDFLKESTLLNCKSLVVSPQKQSAPLECFGNTIGGLNK